MMEISQYLKINGPCLSTRLAKRLVSQKGLTEVAARKVVSRLGPGIARLSGISFPNRAKFVYLQEQYLSQKFRLALIKELKEGRTAAGRALTAIECRNGSITRAMFDVVCGAPSQNRRGHVRSDTVLKQLVDNNLVKLEKNVDFGEIVTLDGFEWSASARTDYEIEQIAIDMLHTWIQKTGCGSWGKVSVRGDSSASRFAGYAWDLIAPSYLCGLRRNGSGAKPRQGYLVADVFLGKPLSLLDLEGVLHKHRALQFQRNVPCYLPIILSEGFERDSLLALKREGFLTAQTDVFFGEQGARALKSLAQSLKNATAILGQNPNHIFDLLTSLIKFNGASLNVRGALFEFVLAYMYQKAGYKLEMRKVVRNDAGESAEIDIQATNRELVFVECKSFLPTNNIALEDVQHWVENKLPIINGWFKKYCELLPKSARFEFYASCRFSKEVREYCTLMQNRYKQRPVSFHDIDSVFQRLKVDGETKVFQIVNEHFSPTH